MPRLHLVELEDLPWFPATLRDGGTAFLALAERMSGHGRQMLGPLKRLLRATGATQPVDLCSGSGGPSPLVLDALRARGHAVDLVLTDVYPAGPALQAAADGRPGLRAHPEPVDARAVPGELRGVRTIWNAFHLVSWLRVYSEDELRELICGVHAPGWVWEVGRQRLGGAPLHGTCLIGHPAPPAA